MLQLSRQSCRSQCDQQIPSTESSKMIDDKSPRSVDGFFHGKKHRKADGTFNTYTWSCFFGGKHIWIWITYEYSMGKSKIRVVEVLNGKSCIMFMGDVPAVAMWHWLPEGKWIVTWKNVHFSINEWWSIMLIRMISNDFIVVWVLVIWKSEFVELRSSPFFRGILGLMLEDCGVFCYTPQNKGITLW